MKRPATPVTLSRAVQVERIPAGTRHWLPAGTEARITQALGGSFTLWVEGQLVRLAGEEADAIGQPRPLAPAVPEGATPAEVEALVWQTLHSCYDPEIPVDIVELGLVYGCALTPMAGGQLRVTIQMTLTAPGCGMGESIANEVCDKLLALPPVGEATVSLVFDPPWDRSRMSEAAQLSLGL
ncbi:MAG: putative Fe-S cluster assembly protein SufT [Burkholderiales bacterium]|nr:putative Fe-S cluster assembly protein SufT [Burkholderiales bacterium]